MRLIDADVLIDEIKKDTQKVIKQDDKVGSFWLGYAAGLVIKQPTIQHEKAQLSQEGTTSDLISRQAAIDAAKDWCEGLICGSVNGLIKKLKALPTVPPEPQWISVTERLPDNADHPGAFCPRYQVVTPYGVTEGWYRPHDHEKGGQWFALFWFMSQIYEIWNIDFERGDVPKVIGEAPVMEWRPLPEPYKPNK